MVLTPGVIYNSAYYEHSFLAQQMGVELVEGRDLVVRDGLRLHADHDRLSAGRRDLPPHRRRLSRPPQVFRPESLLGVPGHASTCIRKGHGWRWPTRRATAVADDKVIYAFVPEMIRYYLNEEPILPNVKTYVCANDEHRKYVLEHLDELVVKAANEAGGYGMLVGPHSTKEQQAEFARAIEADPRNYIAQPTLSLSRVPTLVNDHFEGRHVDLRPYILCGEKTWVLPGGLTRVALRKGSLVVNSSQGGGSKDTWVVARSEEEAAEAETPL